MNKKPNEIIKRSANSPGYYYITLADVMDEELIFVEALHDVDADTKKKILNKRQQWKKCGLYPNTFVYYEDYGVNRSKNVKRKQKGKRKQKTLTFSLKEKFKHLDINDQAR